MFNIKIKVLTSERSLDIFFPPLPIIDPATYNFNTNQCLKTLQMILNIKNLNILKFCNKLNKCTDEDIIN